MGLLRGGYTPKVQEAVTRLGGRLPYGEAQEELSQLWRIEISRATVRNITLRYGRIADELIDEEVAQLQREGSVAREQPEQMVMSTDGAMVLTTGGEWREVKLMTLGEFDTIWDEKKKRVTTRTRDISYFTRLAEASDFGEAAVYEWHRRGGAAAKRVVAVNDGAAWIQSFIDYHCPKAIRVIDYAHAQSYVAQIGRELYGEEPETFRNWFKKMSQQLGHMPPHRTLADLSFLKDQHGDHPALPTITQALGYLQRREKMIDYPHFRRLGIPIGSGTVESGHKVVMQRRMKQAGMRWSENNINPMLALRMAICNHRWSETWQKIQHRGQAARPIKRVNKPSTTVSSQVIGEKEVASLKKLARKLDPQTRQNRAWKDHHAIFPHRAKFSHQK